MLLPVVKGTLVAVVDTHCHASPAWYEPVESLLQQMDRHGVAQAVLIQINGQTDNAYQAECLRRFPGRFASVVIVDTSRADAPATLMQEAERGASGLRLRASARSAGDDPLAIWAAADRLGLVVSCQGTPAEFGSADFAQVVQTLPGLSIVIEHLASLGRPAGEPYPADVIERVLALARFPNLTIKVPGLGEFCRRATPVKEPFPFVEPIPPLLDQVYAAFGPERMMWGSDFPPVSGREGYANALRFPMELLAPKGQAARDQVFGATAQRIFRLPS